jgi:hypothetical protein
MTFILIVDKTREVSKVLQLERLPNILSIHKTEYQSPPNKSEIIKFDLYIYSSKNNLLERYLQNIVLGHLPFPRQEASLQVEI